MLKCSPVTHHKLSKSLHIAFAILGGILLVLAVVLLLGWLDTPLSQLIAEITQRRPKPSWPGYFRKGGMVLLAGGLILLLNQKLIQGFRSILERGKAWWQRTDQWLAQKTSGVLDT